MRSVEEHQRVVAGLITAGAATTADLTGAAGQVLSSDVAATLRYRFSTIRPWTVMRCSRATWPRRQSIDR